MPWSWKIGRVRGIQIFVHATFVFIVAWAALAGWSEEKTIAGAVSQVAFVLALFACIVLHELGHALMALRFGIKTRDITLLPIGGVARLERMPKEPMQELAVALAGPAVNVVIGIAIAGALWVTGGFSAFTTQAVIEGSFLERLMIVNVFLVLFNLLPAFPMDGGRALRALLASRLDPLRATRIAAGVGQGMAVIFGLLGLFANPFLVLIAVFVWMGAAQEAAMAQAEALLGSVPAERATIRSFSSIQQDDPLGKVVQLELLTPQTDFPVVDAEGNVTGMLTQAALLRGLREHGPQGTVAEVMVREVPAIDVHETLEEALKKFQTCQCGALPVMREGRLEGLLTREKLQAFANIQRALAYENRGGPSSLTPRSVEPQRSDSRSMA